MRFVRFVCTGVAAFGLLSLLLVAQEPDDEAKKAADAKKQTTQDLKAEADLLKQQKAVIDAQQDLLLSLAPPSTTKALEGKTSIAGNLAIETQIIADRALATEAAKLGVKLAKSKPQGVFIFVKDEDIAAMAAVRPLNQQLRDLKSRLDKVIPTDVPLGASGAESLGAVTAAPALASGVLSSVADLVALFRTDTEITAQTVAIDREATVGHLAAALLADSTKPTVYYADLMPPRLLSDEAPPIVADMRELEASLAKGKEVLAVLDKVAGESKDEKGKRVGARLDLKAAVDTTQVVVTKLNTPDASTGRTPLNNLSHASRLAQIAGGDDALVVVVKVLKAGGQTRVDRNLWRGSRVEHSGGFILSCFAFDSNGHLVFSETVRGYEGPVQFKKK